MERRHDAPLPRPTQGVVLLGRSKDANELHRNRAMPNIRITAELIPEEEGGYTVYCPELDIYTQGDTERECLENLREAAELHLEELGDLASVRKVIRHELEIRACA